MKLVQCVPNFSEGKDKAKVDAIVAAIAGVSGVFVMDVEMDPNHNRSVVTFFGSPDAVADGAVAGAREALKHIDMPAHKGEHPRIGATDVVPFTPVLGVGMPECAALAERVGERLARELSIPVYLYGLAAKKPERSNLAFVRKGEYEGLSREIGNPERHPDFGEPKMHPTGGATAVGAREHIINFNVNLRSQDKALAAGIARAIRTSSGGLPHLRAKEIELADKKQVQISTVLTNYSATGLSEALSSIKDQARNAGVEISDSELVGLVPARALIDFALKKLKVTGFNPEAQIFENKLLGLLAGQAVFNPGASWLAGLESLCQAMADPVPVPGGGSLSAALGALGVSLAEKVCEIHRKKIAKAGVNGQVQALLMKLAGTLPSRRKQFMELAAKDSQAYGGVAQAFRIPKDKGLERAAAIDQALRHASQIPLETMQAGLETLQTLSEYKPIVPEAVASDLKVGVYAIGAGVQGAKENVLINLHSIKDEKFKNAILAKLTALESRLKEFLVD